MDGLEMMQRLHARRPNLPVIIMSGTFDVGKGPLPAGAAGFLTKPFRLEQLLAVIAEALRANRSAVESASSAPV
jgi:FixJ family two-component response regulator